MSSYRVEFTHISLIRIVIIVSMLLSFIHILNPVPIVGFLVFWLSFIANPFLVSYLLFRGVSLRTMFLLALSGGWLNHFGICLVLMYTQNFTSFSLGFCFMIEGLLCFLICCIPYVDRPSNYTNYSIEFSLDGFTRTRVFSLVLIFLSAFLLGLFYLTGIFNPFADTVDLWSYINPGTISIVLPIAIGTLLLSKNGASNAEILTYYIVGVIIRILPNLLFGPVWESDVFQHQYFSEIILTHQIEAYPILYSEMAVPMYPLLAYHVLNAAGLALSGDLWFFVTWTIFNHTIMYIALIGFFRHASSRVQLFALFLYTVFPSLIRYFSLPRPFEIVSALFAVAVALTLISKTESKSEKRRLVIWLMILLFIGTSAHVYGIFIFLVLLAFLAYTFNVSLSSYIGNRIFSVLKTPILIFIALFPFISIGIFFLIPMDYLVTPVPILTRMLQNIRRFSGGPSDFSIWLESLSYNAFTANLYSSFIAFFPVVGFLLNMYLFYGPTSKGKSVLHDSRHRFLVIVLSIQLLLLWFTGFFFMPLILSGRVGVHFGWIIFSLGIVAVLEKSSYRNRVFNRLREISHVLLILFLSFGLIVAYAPAVVYDENDFEMASWIHTNIPTESGIACSSEVKKILLAFSHYNVRVDLTSWSYLLEGNLSATAIEEFIKSGYPHIINFTVSFVVINHNLPLKGLDQPHLVTLMEYSPYFQIVGLGATWIVFEVRFNLD